MSKQVLSTQDAPQAIGPYAQGIAFGDLVFTSGQLPLSPKTGELTQSTIEEATHQAIKNLEAVLKAAGSDLSKVIKATVLLKDLNDFAKMNKVYGEYFGANPPARTCFQAAKLPMDAIFEIEAIAHK